MNINEEAYYIEDTGENFECLIEQGRRKEITNENLKKWGSRLISFGKIHLDKERDFYEFHSLEEIENIIKKKKNILPYTDTFLAVYNLVFPVIKKRKNIKYDDI